MSRAGKLTPLQVNTFTSFMQNKGLNINPDTESYMGSSTAPNDWTPGTLVTSTVLNTLSGGDGSITRLAYDRYTTASLSSEAYLSLLTLGTNSIPALGNTPTSSYNEVPTTNIKWRDGFLRLVAQQAFDEYAPRGAVVYSDFLATFNQCESFKSRQNDAINTLINSRTFMASSYSNMNDLVTADITGISNATLYWGQDLIATGKAIDLSSIDSFGNPANLLLTLQTYNALTKAVVLSILSSGITNSELTEILNKTKQATVSQQKKIYGAFSVIQGKDLKDVLTPLNCQTPNLISLADLLDPKKLFPKSYTTLTVPSYNATAVPTNSKTYYLIYSGGGINLQLEPYGEKLRNIIPKEVAIACGALSYSMMQVKHIKNMQVEKFSQVVANLETMTGLGVNGSSVPVAQDQLEAAIEQIALGSGPDGTYTTNDFFGAMTGLENDFQTLQTKILSIDTSRLSSLYRELQAYLSSTSNAPYSAISNYVSQINTEISTVQTAHKKEASEINELWDALCDRLKKEQANRLNALRYSIGANYDIADMLSFVQSLDNYSSDTEPYQAAQVLEAISCGVVNTQWPNSKGKTPATLVGTPDTKTLGGQSLVGSMREARNAARLGLTNGELDNNVPDANPTLAAQQYSQDTQQNPLLTSMGIEKVTGAAAIPGSLAGSPDRNLVPDNLGIFKITGVLIPTVVTPTQAVDDVTTCNCDCWDLLR